MKKQKQSFWLGLALAAVLIPGLCWAVSRHDNPHRYSKPPESFLSDILLRGIEGDSSIVCASIGLARVGSGKAPETVVWAWDAREHRWAARYGYDELPLPPGGIMQTATYTYLLDKGLMKVDEQIPTRNGRIPEFRADRRYPADMHIVDFERTTGHDSISLREGFLRNMHYVSDLLALERLTSYDWPNARTFVEWLGDAFGSADAFFLPKFDYQGKVFPAEFASIADGTGVLLSQGQVLSFYGALAHGGVKPAGKGYRIRRICSKKTAEEMCGLLRENVLSGTAARLSDCGVSVAAKTGFGMLDKGRITGDGVASLSVTSLAGFFPADAPEYTLCVTLYSTLSVKGGESACIFKEVVHHLMEEGKR